MKHEGYYGSLQSWGAVRLLESVWVVSVNGGAGAVREELRGVIDSDDSVVVVELKFGSEWSAIRARIAGTDWLTANIRNYG
jgi:hypothetical protein